MKTVLTKESAAEYVSSGGSKCPFCGSTNIEGDSLDVDGPTATGNCRCFDCSEEWVDTYTLTDVGQ